MSGVLRVIPASPVSGDYHDVEVDDPDALLENFKQGLQSPNNWLETKDGQLIQVRHIVRMFVWR